MPNMHLVTGYAGEPHVSADDHASFNSLFFGDGEFVVNRGNMLNASIISNNQIRVLDGDIMMQGRYVRLYDGSFVDLAIENGVQDNRRNDLIVARYTKDVTTGVEEVNLVVIKGTASTSGAVDPEFSTGLIGSTMQHDMPLYRVTLYGLNILKVESLFRVVTLGENFAMEHHEHSAYDIVVGILPEKHGGTGCITLDAHPVIRELLTNVQSAMNNANQAISIAQSNDNEIANLRSRINALESSS